MAEDEPQKSTERLGDLFDGRAEWVPQPSEGKREALISGLVVLDTNVLLHLYRFGAEARQELINVIELVGDRLFIPARVAEEFLRLRLPVAMDVRKELKNGAEQAAKSLQKIGKDLISMGRNRSPASAAADARYRCDQRIAEGSVRLPGTAMVTMCRGRPRSRSGSSRRTTSKQESRSGAGPVRGLRSSTARKPISTSASW